MFFQALAKLRLVRFVRNELDEAMKYVKERVYLPRNGDDVTPMIYTCGLGGSEYAENLRVFFNIQ